MGKLVTINFRSRAIRTDRALEVKVRDCLKAFNETGTYDAALKLCRTACPDCEVGLAQALSDGRWLVEVRYDNLLHEGEGETVAAALKANNFCAFALAFPGDESTRELRTCLAAETYMRGSAIGCS